MHRLGIAVLQRRLVGNELAQAGVRDQAEGLYAARPLASLNFANLTGATLRGRLSMNINRAGAGRFPTTKSLPRLTGPERRPSGMQSAYDAR